MPPLAGPSVMLYWTRYPVNTSISPLSICTGQDTVICRFGPRQDFPDAGFEFEDARRSVEFLEHGTEDGPVCRHGCVLVERARRTPVRRGTGMKHGGPPTAAAKRPNVLPAQP